MLLNQVLFIQGMLRLHPYEVFIINVNNWELGKRFPNYGLLPDGCGPAVTRKLPGNTASTSIVTHSQ